MTATAAVLHAPSALKPMLLFRSVSPLDLAQYLRRSSEAMSHGWCDHEAVRLGPCAYRLDISTTTRLTRQLWPRPTPERYWSRPSPCWQSHHWSKRQRAPLRLFVRVRRIETVARSISIPEFIRLTAQCTIESIALDERCCCTAFCSTGTIPPLIRSALPSSTAR